MVWFAGANGHCDLSAKWWVVMSKRNDTSNSQPTGEKDSTDITVSSGGPTSYPTDAAIDAWNQLLRNYGYA
jgi:hypothetical protein